MYRKHLKQLQNHFQQRLGAYHQLQQNIHSTEETIEKIQKDVQLATQTLELLTLTSKEGRERAKEHLESIVTKALQYVLDEECQFLIELSEIGGKPSCEFYITTVIDGKLSKQRPQLFCGGGTVDLISATLRYAYVEIFDDPAIRNRLMILDEPSKMVSKDAAVRFAEFIRWMSEEFNKQTLMITHQDALTSQADQVLVVRKVDGKSEVSVKNLEIEGELDE